MQHRRKGRRFGRPASQRKAMYRTLVGSLVMHEKITTTEAKAKEIKMVFDRYITIAKRSLDDQKKLASSRLLNSRLPKSAATRLLQEDFLKRFDTRQGGYTRVTKLGRRKSDSAPMAIIELV